MRPFRGLQQARPKRTYCWQWRRSPGSEPVRNGSWTKDLAAAAVVTATPAVIYIRTCCGMAAAMLLPTPATTHGRYRPGSATRTSSTRFDTPSFRHWPQLAHCRIVCIARARAAETQALFCRRRHQPRRGKAKFSHPRLKKIASFHCGLTMSKGNCRANGISERESNNQPDCKDDQDISHTSTELLVSVGPGRVPTGCCSSIVSSWPERMERAKFEASERLQSARTA